MTSQDSRAEYDANGTMTHYDGRTVYYNTADDTQWVAVSNGVANTHNADYDREMQNSVPVSIIHEATEDSEAWRESTCTYDHIISIETYIADNSEPQEAPVGEGASSNDTTQCVWGNWAGHTPDWVIRYGTN